MWRKIEEIDDGTRYAPGLLLYAETLIDADFNPSGVVEGYWQDGDDESGDWVAAVWCGYHDEWHSKPVKPTHFMIKEGPQ